MYYEGRQKVMNKGQFPSTVGPNDFFGKKILTKKFLVFTISEKTQQDRGHWEK